MPDPTPIDVTAADVRAALPHVRAGVAPTPCVRSEALSDLLDADVWLKHEHRLPTGSFKERGARHALATLDPDARKRGVIAASAGNHALALAYHGRALSIPVTVVTPIHAPVTKVARAVACGAAVLQQGNDIAEARDHALTLVDAQGLTYINGFDHPAILAGAGTLALEAHDQLTEHGIDAPDAVVVPLGGGGLLAGIGLIARDLWPNARVVGVEPARAASYAAAIQHGGPTRITMDPTLADGLAVPRVGDNAYPILRRVVDQAVTVTEPDIALAVVRLLEMEKQVVEGAGAAGVAALLTGAAGDLKGRRVLVPLCGGNIDLTTLDRLILRGMAHDGRLCQLHAVISDRPGGLAAFAALLAEQRVSVKDLRHDRVFSGDDIATVHVDCLLETRDHDHRNALLAALNDAGFNADCPQT